MSTIITVSVSFSEEDADFAEKVVLGLIDKGIIVKTNSYILKNKVPNWGRHLLDIVNEQFADDVDFCIVLVTKNFARSKWNQYSKCSLLEQAYRRKNFILPVKIGKETPSIPGLALIDYLNVDENDFQVVIDSFVEKAKISNIGIDILKGYRDIEDILRLKDPNADWIKLSNDEDIDRNKNIGFDLYANNDKLLERIQSYILYLYQGSAIKHTFDYIIETYPKIFRDRNLIILIPYEEGQIDFEKRKNNIKAAFSNAKVIYIKEFIWEYCTPKDFRLIKNDIPISNFVIPNVLLPDKVEPIRADKFIIDWQKEDNNPLLVIKGEGGIGKSTLAKWITNYVERNIPNTKSIFIDSLEITAYLKRSLEITNQLDLYKFYEADFEEKQTKNKDQIKKLGTTEFKCNLDNGNIVLIIDGFDEVLNHLDSYFDIDDFLASIYSLSSNIGKGKVVITSRNHYWDKYKYNLNSTFNYETIQVCPFDYKLTFKYFSSYFNSNEKFVEKAFQIARELMLGGHDNYIPFILDLVTYIVENRYDNNYIKDSKFEAEDSNFLNKAINNDYLLFKICDREIIKLHNVLEIGDQINFFIRLSTYYNGKIKESKLLSELNELSGNKATSKTIEAIKAHPILTYSNETAQLVFKYDLFEEHFKNIYLGLLLNGKEEVNNHLITILSDYNAYNSSFNDTLLLRMGKMSEDKILTLLNILDVLKAYKINDRNITSEIKNRAISSFFLLILKYYHKSNANNIKTNTLVLKEFFCSENRIKHFSLINCNRITAPKIAFDFSGLTFENSFFSNYEFFPDCKFNDKTRFENCKFDSLQLNISKQYSFKPHNFINPDGDINFKDYFKFSGRKAFNTKKEIIADFETFLNLFYESGKIYNVYYTDLKKKYHPNIISLDRMIDAFNKYKMLNRIFYGKYKQEKYDIAEEYKYQVVNFVTNGANSTVIENLLSFIINLYK